MTSYSGVTNNTLSSSTQPSNGLMTSTSLASNASASNNLTGNNLSDNRRGRATREQLAILEDSFNTNSQPNAKIREQLSKRLNMSERSVQIWFQNRRAKIKMSQRKVHMALKEEALRQHCMAAYTNRVSGLPPQILAKTAPLPNASFFSPNPSLNYNSSPFMNESQFGQPKTAAFPCSIITIGTWKRMPMGTDDLVCGFNLESKHMAWVIGDNATRFRIGFPFSSLTRIELGFLDSVHAEITFTLKEPPTFSVLQADKRWTPCSDFTENSQASDVFKHVIVGEAQGMRVQLLKLIEADHGLSTVTTITSPDAGGPPIPMGYNHGPSSGIDNHIGNPISHQIGQNSQFDSEFEPKSDMRSILNTQQHSGFDMNIPMSFNSEMPSMSYYSDPRGYSANPEQDFFNTPQMNSHPKFNSGTPISSISTPNPNPNSGLFQDPFRSPPQPLPTSSSLHSVFNNSLDQHQPPASAGADHRDPFYLPPPNSVLDRNYLYNTQLS